MEVKVDVELAFCEIIVATCCRGLDWTWIWKQQANNQPPAAFAQPDGRFAEKPDWEIRRLPL